MKRILPLILAAIIMPSCAIIIVVSSMHLSEAKSSLDEKKMTLGYSCGFVAGQYAIMNRMPTIFKDRHETPEHCKRFEAVAGKNGFDRSQF
jgi:hypothetical protein